MRDPRRIGRLLKLIADIWRFYPDLRLYQLLGNCFPPGDHYYTGDDELEAGLKQTYYGVLNVQENTKSKKIKKIKR